MITLEELLYQYDVELYLSQVLRGKKSAGFMVLSRLHNKARVSFSPLKLKLHCTPSGPKGEVRGTFSMLNGSTVCVTPGISYFDADAQHADSFISSDFYVVRAHE